MNNVYATPEADLNYPSTSDSAGGAIEDAISGNIEISMTGTMGEAWRNLKGFKMKCHVAFLLYFIVAIAAAFISVPVIFGFTAIGADLQAATILGSVIQMVASIAVMPMFMGIHIMGMRHAENKSVSAGSIFGYFNKIPAIFLCYLMMVIMIVLGSVLLILPGIYLMYAYMFAMPLVVEKNLPAWRALEISRKALTRIWFRFFGFVLLLMLINVIAMIPLGIGMIWSVPWSVLTMSMVYTKLFGAEPHTLAD